jgi:hypothetical protein
MSIKRIGDVIAKSSNEIAGEKINDICIDCLNDSIDLMESNMKSAGKILEFELLKLGQMIQGIGQDVCSPDKENIDNTGTYESILVNVDEVDRHLKTIRTYAEAKMYFEAQYYGTIGRLESETN